MYFNLDLVGQYKTPLSNKQGHFVSQNKEIRGHTKKYMNVCRKQYDLFFLLKILLLLNLDINKTIFSIKHVMKMPKKIRHFFSISNWLY